MTTIKSLKAASDESAEPELIPAPEGVEFTMSIYLKCDAIDASTCLHFPGNHFVPPVAESVDPDELIASLPPEHRTKLAVLGKWRVMTRAEITRYKLQQVQQHGRA